MTFTTDGNAFVKLSDRTVTVWRRSEAKSESIQLPQCVRSVSLSPNGKWAAAAGVGGIVHLFDTTQPRRDFAALEHPRQVDWSEFNRRVNELGISYRSPEATAIQQQRAALEGDVDVLGFSANGSYLLTTGTDFVVRLWDVASRRIRTVLLPHEGSAFSLDGRFVAMVKDDKDLVVLEPPGGRRVFSFSADGRLSSVVMNTTRSVVTALEETRTSTSDTPVSVWQSSHWQSPLRIEFGQDGPEPVASCNGDYLAFCRTLEHGARCSSRVRP